MKIFYTLIVVVAIIIILWFVYAHYIVKPSKGIIKADQVITPNPVKTVTNTINSGQGTSASSGSSTHSSSRIINLK